MSLIGQINLLATRIGDECQALWAAVNDKPGQLVSNGLTGSSTYRERRNVLIYVKPTANNVGSLVIDTGITFANRMTTLHIRGYNYFLSDSILDWKVHFYATSAPSIVNGTVLLRGDYGPTAIRLMRNPTTNTVVVVVDTATDWDYPKITVDVTVGHTTVPDSELDPANWSATITTDTSAYTQLSAPATQRVLRNTLNLSDISNAATARTNLGAAPTASPTFTGTTTTDVLHAYGTVEIGNANADLGYVTSLVVEDDTRNLTFTYSGGNLATVVEKDGATTMRTTTINYTSGTVSSVVEVGGGKTVTTTLGYTGSDLTSTTRSVV